MLCTSAVAMDFATVVSCAGEQVCDNTAAIVWVFAEQLGVLHLHYNRQHLSGNVLQGSTYNQSVTNCVVKLDRVNNSDALNDGYTLLK